MTSQYDIINLRVGLLVEDPPGRCIFLWWFCRGCSPLPIPNREVKPLMADGTAPQCGRVGSCHIHLSPVRFLTGLFYARQGLRPRHMTTHPASSPCPLIPRSPTTHSLRISSIPARRSIRRSARPHPHRRIKKSFPELYLEGFEQRCID